MDLVPPRRAAPQVSERTWHDRRRGSRTSAWNNGGVMVKSPKDFINGNWWPCVLLMGHRRPRRRWTMHQKSRWSIGRPSLSLARALVSPARFLSLCLCHRHAWCLSVSLFLDGQRICSCLKSADTPAAARRLLSLVLSL